MKKRQVGIIGSGMWGRVHIDSVREDGRGEVKWIASRTDATKDKVMEDCDIPQGTTDHQDILNDPDVDAVIIASPPKTHAPLFLESIQAGKHVILEKPMAISHEETEQIVAEAENHPELVMLEASCRFTRLQPKYDVVKKMIADGKLGDIYYVHHRELKPTTYLEYNPKATWTLMKSESGGGPTMDWGVYDLSFDMGVLGDNCVIEDVKSLAVNGLRSAHGGPNPEHIEQHCAALIEFANGVHLYYERGGGAYGSEPNFIRIHGTQGGLQLHYLPWSGNTMAFFHENESGKIVQEDIEVDMSGIPDNPNTGLIQHFMDCLDGTAEPIMPVAAAKQQWDIIARILAQ